MSLSRLTITDDSGGGTDGTIANAAWVTLLEDMIDARWSVAFVSSTGTQNNLSVSDADLVIFTNASDLTITGIAAPTSPVKYGKPLRMICMGAGNVFLSHLSASSTSTNRFVNDITSAATPLQGAGAGVQGGFATYVYSMDSTLVAGTARWRLQQHEQGGFIAYTPTWGNTGTANSLGNGTLTGEYYVRGKRCDLRIKLTWGSTTTGGSSVWTFTLPFTADAVGVTAHSVVEFDSSAGATGHYQGQVFNSSTTVIGVLTNASPGGGFGGTVPFTWATSDVLEVGGSFQLA